MDWTKAPSHVQNSDLEKVDYLISIDETGIPSLKNIENNSPDHVRWFTISGCIFNKDDINGVADSIIALKNKYWSEGLYHNHRIYLHSRDIRRHYGPFHLENSTYVKFRHDLDLTIQESPMYICSATTEDGGKSYWPFELSDIICYRINHFITTGIESDNFSVIKPKIMGYPNHIQGRGIKKFP